MKYFECDVPPGNGACSDNACPCPDVTIHRGTGYLFIEQSLVDFRQKYPGLKDAKHAMEQQLNQKHAIFESAGSTFTAIYRIGPILVCEEGARLRNLDLNVASADAKHSYFPNATAVVVFDRQCDCSATLAFLATYDLWIGGIRAKFHLERHLQQHHRLRLHSPAVNVDTRSTIAYATLQPRTISQRAVSPAAVLCHWPNVGISATSFGLTAALSYTLERAVSRYCEQPENGSNEQKWDGYQRTKECE